MSEYPHASPFTVIVDMADGLHAPRDYVQDLPLADPLEDPPDPDIERLTDWAIADARPYLDHLHRRDIAHVIGAALFQAARAIRRGERVTLPEIGTFSHCRGGCPGLVYAVAHGLRVPPAAEEVHHV